MEILNNEEQIRNLVEEWAKAVRDKNLDKILVHHSEDIAIYDVPKPFKSIGIESYRKTWDTFFAWAKNEAVYNIKNLHITAGSDVAFCYAEMQCAGLDNSGKKEVLDFRLTMGLQKINNQWMILHEHHSIPAE